jgi:hypothetical protein
MHAHTDTHTHTARYLFLTVRTYHVHVCSLILNEITTTLFTSGTKFLTNTIYHCETHYTPTEWTVQYNAHCRLILSHNIWKYQFKVFYICSFHTYLYQHPPFIYQLNAHSYISKVKQSRNSPGVARCGPEGSTRFRLPDFVTFGMWRWWGCQPHTPAAFTPRNVPGTHFH